MVREPDPVCLHGKEAEVNLDRYQTPWYDTPIDHEAVTTGEIGVNGKAYRKGEFMPFYVPRPVMPQIDDADYSELISWLASQGVSGMFGSANPITLIPHQRIDKFRAEQMPDAVKKIAVLISEDNYILDGNHRWQANMVSNSRVNYIRILLPFERAIEKLFAFPKVMTSNTEQFKDGLK